MKFIDNPEMSFFKKRVILGSLALGMSGVAFIVLYQNSFFTRSDSDESGSLPGNIQMVETREPPRIRQTAPGANLVSPIVRDAAGLMAPAYEKPPLQLAIDKHRDILFKDRLAALQTEDGPLSAHEVTVLLRFVEQNPSELNLASHALRALENDILNLLQLHGGNQSSEIIAVLKRIAQDKEQPLIKRDYALQHLASFEKPQQAAGVHWDTIESGPSELAATAMLHILSQQRYGDGLGEKEAARLGVAALELASKQVDDSASRATALQVCGRLKLEQVRPLATQIAQTSAEPMPLRIAAVAALGHLPENAETRLYLQGLVGGSIDRLRLPATNALSNFTN